MLKIALYTAGAVALLLVLYALLWILLGAGLICTLSWCCWRAGLVVGRVRARRELKAPLA